MTINALDHAHHSPFDFHEDCSRCNLERRNVMTDAQLLYILEKKYSGSHFSSIRFTVIGNMIVEFVDSDANRRTEVVEPNGLISKFV